MYIAFISGLHRELGIYEIETLVKEYGGTVIHKGAQIVIFQGKFPFERLSLTKFVCRRIDNLEKEHFKDYSIRVVTKSEKKERLIKEIAKRVRGNVNLSHPKNELLVFGELIGRKVFEINPKGFELRRPKNRPFFHPSTLDARWSRLLVNISGAREGESLLDPFCGSGAILIEAGLMGIGTIGIDLNERMVEGSRRNLEFYGVKNFRLVHGNAIETRERADVVVTDLPYGRGSSLCGLEREELYSKFLSRLGEMYRKRAVVVANQELEGASKLFRVRVHKSLTRNIHVFEK